MDRIQAMKVFLAVVDEGGFTAAARALSMTVSNVTRQVATLEAHLGTRLLQRTTRRVALTPAGMRYAARTRDILRSVDEAFTEVQNSTAALSGVLRIVASPTFVDFLISPMLAPLRAAYPGITLDVHIDSSPVPDVGQFDIALLHVPVGFDANIVARTLSTHDGILCASPSYVQLHGSPQRPEQLGAHQCLLKRSAHISPQTMQLWHAGRDMREPPDAEVEVMPLVTINHPSSLLQMVLDGAGIAAFSAQIVQPFLAHGLLQQVLPGWITGRFAVMAALPSHRHIPERTKVFLDFVADFHRQHFEQAHC